MSPQGWCPPAPSAARASERPRAMTADAIPDRRVTVPTRGLDPAFVDGSRLYWALPSRVHEGFWFRASSPTGYKVMRCFPHVDHGPVQEAILPTLRHFTRELTVALQIVEARHRRIELKIDRTGRAVALLADDDFRLAMHRGH